MQKKSRSDNITKVLFLADKKVYKGYLMDICLTAQDNYKALLDYFKVK